ncbi:MAG TPA: MgtC/SapB family protein [Gemmatimonadales bacterium]|nr:MgtC/SapB family protein [Gemmatimonadales bacterium]
MTIDLQLAGTLVVAALSGTAVGIERQRSGHTVGPHARFAGARTFFLIGTLGGMCGWLVRDGLMPLAVALLAGGALLIVAAYVIVARQGGDAIDGTTEMAALVTLSLGLLSGLGYPLITSAVTSIMLLVLAEKTRIHRAIERVGDLELASALRFSVLALVVLPLLPAGPFGPGDVIRPRAIWSIVLVFSAINFGAFLAIRTLGVQRGYGASGLLGGLISSTAVTLQFSRRSRGAPALGDSLALGLLGACVVLVVRIEVLTALLNPTVALLLIRYLAPALLVGAAVLYAWYRRGKNAAGDIAEHNLGSPLGLRSALLMAVGFQAAILIMGAVQASLGSAGVVLSAAVLGLTDMDALTYAMSRLGRSTDQAELAARSIAIGMIANTVLKTAIVTILGQGRFRRVTLTGLVLLLAGGLAGLWLAALMPAM